MLIGLAWEICKLLAAFLGFAKNVGI